MFIYSILGQKNAEAKSLQECKSLQCYIFDAYEHALLIKTLLNLVMANPEKSNVSSTNPFTSSLVVVLLAMMHTSDWLGFAGKMNVGATID